mgnify:CR=1 FL=1
MSHEQEQPSAPSILAVEDDVGIGAFLLQAITQETAYHMVLTTHSMEALQIAQDIKPALFILNYNLPLMNGIELYDLLHAIPGLENVPTIMISAILPKNELQQRNIIGITKPFELDLLLNAIEQLLG